MKQQRMYSLVVLLIGTLLLSACNGKGGYQTGATYKWDVVNKHYKNFTDLGDYVIDVDKHTHFDFDRTLAFSNKRYDKWSKLPGGGCFASEQCMY